MAGHCTFGADFPIIPDVEIGDEDRVPHQQPELPAHLEGLNEPQLKAVCHVCGPLLILAGAGSGKTRVLTHRIAQLVFRHGVSPEQILAVTFTNKAAGEMKERLERLLGERARRLWMSTFHSAGLRILRRHAQHLSYDRDFVVYDQQDSLRVVKRLLRGRQIDESKYTPKKLLKAIEAAKSMRVTAEEYAAGQPDSCLQAEVYDLYERELLASNAMDFGDLLLKTVLLFERRPELLAAYRDRLHYVLVDEFQDTNRVQYLLVKQLVEPRRNLAVVGDDDQSIYAFRGADISNILNFEADYPEAQVVKLEQNYRSSAAILEAAHSIIRRNPGRKEKKLWTASSGGEAVKTFVGRDEEEEACFVAEEILKYVEGGAAFDDVALFYRTNAQSRALEEALMDLRLPYRVYGGLKFYDRKEVKDVIAYLRLLVNPADNEAFLRVVNTPPRGIGAQSIKRLMVEVQAGGSPSLWQRACELAEGNKKLGAFVNLINELSALSRSASLGELLHETVVRTGYLQRLEASKDESSQSRIENLQELQAIGTGLEFHGDDPPANLQRFLDRVVLPSGDESPEDQHAAAAGAVSLMTLHLAKGLEFPIVFFTGVEEGLLPHYLSMDDEAGVAEERRLCYVGVTRAKEILYLTRARRRGMFSAGSSFGLSGRFREPSRFLFDVPPGHLECVGDDYDGGFDGDAVDDSHWEAEEYDEWQTPQRPAVKQRTSRSIDLKNCVKSADELASDD